MTIAVRLLWITFAESVGTVLLERGLYFYTHDLFAFGDRENLLLAFLFGAVYVIGALASHRASLELGHKRVLVATLLALWLVHAFLTVRPNAAVISSAFAVIALLHGLKWPIVESFFSAGQTPAELVRGLGRFNVCWALAVPIAVAGSGPLIASKYPQSLFAVAALLNVVALALCRSLPLAPTHLDHGHPERPAQAELHGYAGFLVAARWLLLLSYTLMFLLAPLMPKVFAELGLEVQGATLAASALDAARVLSFAMLGVFASWRFRWSPFWITGLVLPAAFALIVRADGLIVVLIGELLFGVATGISYTTALYYALVIKNAAVAAGGVHESLIGLGFALGPLCGLAGSYLHERALAGRASVATIVAVSPIVLVCCVGAFVAWLTRRETHHTKP